MRACLDTEDLPIHCCLRYFGDYWWFGVSLSRWFAFRGNGGACSHSFLLRPHHMVSWMLLPTEGKALAFLCRLMACATSFHGRRLKFLRLEWEASSVNADG